MFVGRGYRGDNFQFGLQKYVITGVILGEELFVWPIKDRECLKLVFSAIVEQKLQT